MCDSGEELATPNLEYETTFNPSQKSLAPIDQGLHEFNVAHLGQEVIDNYHEVMVVAKVIFLLILNLSLLMWYN